jgi:hypothetical protein
MMGLLSLDLCRGKILARYSPETCFWFAWEAFYPGTKIYSGG